MYPEYTCPRTEAGLARRPHRHPDRPRARGPVRLEGRRHGAAAFGDLAPQDGTDAWDVTVRAIYDLPRAATRARSSCTRTTSRRRSRQAKGLVGWYLVKVDDAESRAGRSAADRRACSRTRRRRPRRRPSGRWRSRSSTRSATSARSLGAIVTAVFFTMLLVTANTMAQSVRERTNEIGVLKTLGFTNGGVLGLVLAESVLITVLGGALGLAGAWWLGVQFEPVFRQYLPGFRVAARGHADGRGLHGGPGPRGRCSAGGAGDAVAHRRGAAAGMNAPWAPGSISSPRSRP